MDCDVFISYSSNDKQVAIRLKTELEKLGVHCWRDKDDLMGGAHFLDEIAQALDSVRIMVLIFSSKTMDSKYVKAELEYAYDNGMHIIPIKIEETVPQKSWKLMLGGRHWEELLEKNQEQITDIAKRIKKNVDIYKAGIERDERGIDALTKRRLDAHSDLQEGERKLLNALYVAYQDGNISNIERDTINSIAMMEAVSTGRIRELEAKVREELGVSETIEGGSQLSGEAQLTTPLKSRESSGTPKMDPAELSHLFSCFPSDKHEFLHALVSAGLDYSPTILLTQVRNLVGEDDYGQDIQRWLYSNYPLKRGTYFNPLAIEKVLSGFTRRQADFLRALVAEGHGGKDVITTADVDSVIKANKGLNWPQWLRTTPEYMHPRRGLYHNPIELRLKTLLSQSQEERPGEGL